MTPLPARRPDGPAEAVERYRTAALVRAISGEHADPTDRASVLNHAERIAIADRRAGP